MERLTRRQRREKKRAEQKQLNKKVRQQGLTRTESKLLNSPAVTKEQKKLKKNIEKKYNYRFLKSLGYTKEEAKRFQGASKETIKKLEKTLATPLKREQIETQKKAAERAARRKRQSNRDTLVVYWKDLIEFAGEETVKSQRSLFKYMDVPSLEGSAKELMKLSFGESPASRIKMELTRDINLTRSFYTAREYHRVYEGTATNYRALLVAVNTMFILLYDPPQKKNFLSSLINLVYALNKKNAKRLLRLTL